VRGGVREWSNVLKVAGLEGGEIEGEPGLGEQPHGFQHFWAHDPVIVDLVENHVANPAQQCAVSRVTGNSATGGLGIFKGNPAHHAGDARAGRGLFEHECGLVLRVGSLYADRCSDAGGVEMGHEVVRAHEALQIRNELEKRVLNPCRIQEVVGVDQQSLR
jgi:hypothetical protein